MVAPHDQLSCQALWHGSGDLDASDTLDFDDRDSGSDLRSASGFKGRLMDIIS